MTLECKYLLKRNCDWKAHVEGEARSTSPLQVEAVQQHDQPPLGADQDCRSEYSHLRQLSVLFALAVVQEADQANEEVVEHILALMELLVVGGKYITIKV